MIGVAWRGKWLATARRRACPRRPGPWLPLPPRWRPAHARRPPSAPRQRVSAGRAQITTQGTACELRRERGRSPRRRLQRRRRRQLPRWRYARHWPERENIHRLATRLATSSAPSSACSSACGSSSSSTSRSLGTAGLESMRGVHLWPSSAASAAAGLASSPTVAIHTSIPAEGRAGGTVAAIAIKRDHRLHFHLQHRRRWRPSSQPSATHFNLGDSGRGALA